MGNWLKKLLLGWLISWLQKRKDEVGKPVESPTAKATQESKPQTNNNWKLKSPKDS